MLTCKSLFGLGYRGERLIEPSIYAFTDYNADTTVVKSATKSLR